MQRLRRLRRACHEGAIAMVNGKAQLMRDDYCDGLGDVFELLAWISIGFFSSEIAPVGAVSGVQAH